MFEFITEKYYEGGPLVMSSIFLVLMISLVIVIERTYRYWREYDLSNTVRFIAALQKLVMNDSIEAAIRNCKSLRPKLLPSVLVEGLKKANDTPEEIENAMEHACLEVLPRVNRGINFLGTAANLATLLGLLGTIFGLIRAFAGAAQASGAEKQALLAEGIAEALTATSLGLSTALFCILAHGLLSMKQSAIMSHIDHGVAKLNDLLVTRRLKLKNKN